MPRRFSRRSPLIVDLVLSNRCILVHSSCLWSSFAFAAEVRAFDSLAIPRSISATFSHKSLIIELLCKETIAQQLRAHAFHSRTHDCRTSRTDPTRRKIKAREMRTKLRRRSNADRTSRLKRFSAAVLAATRGLGTSVGVADLLEHADLLLLVDHFACAICPGRENERKIVNLFARENVARKAI